MSAVSPKNASTTSARTAENDAETRKIRCLCGKWWAYRSGDTIVLRCKLCRRDIVITGENMKIEYR